MPETSAKSKKGKQLDAIAAQVSGCTLCPLWKSRTNAVPGSGNPDATIVIIGEGPGWHEDRQGLPFVGPSGQLLDKLLGSISIGREQVFITNVVKCRPPNNRDPMPIEIETCNPYLTAQLDIIQPRLVITLGRHSMNLFLPDAKITQVHGQPHRDPRTGFTVVPMFHPAAALRQPAWMDALTADFKKLPALLDGLSDAPPPPPTPLPADEPATAAVVEALAEATPTTASELPIVAKPKRSKEVAAPDAAANEQGHDSSRPYNQISSEPTDVGAQFIAPDDAVESGPGRDESRPYNEISSEPTNVSRELAQRFAGPGPAYNEISSEPANVRAQFIAPDDAPTPESVIAEPDASAQSKHDIIAETEPAATPAPAKPRRRAAVESDLAISAAAPASKPKRGRPAAATVEPTADADWEELTGAVEERHSVEKRQGRPRKAETEATTAPNEQPPDAPAKPKPASRREKEEEAGQLTLF